MSIIKPNPTDNPLKGLPAGRTIQENLNRLHANNRIANGGYDKTGTPGDAFHAQGEAPDLSGRMRKGIPTKRMHPHAQYEDHER